MRELKEIIAYHLLLKNLVLADLRLRYRGSLLGYLWTMLNPLLTMLVLTLVFSTVMRFEVEDYAIMLLSGLLPWLAFNQGINGALFTFIQRGPLLRTVYFPKIILPLAAVMSAVVNFVLALPPLLILVVIFGRPVNWSLLTILPAILLLTLFTTACALLFSLLNTFFRDFGHMTEVLLQLWFYGSPIIYPLSMVPEEYSGYFMLNPICYFIKLFREPLYLGHMAALDTWLICAGASVLTLFCTFLAFRRFESEIIFRV
jgi:ABC-type polysaccharide/polyol phosphate export permease